MAGICTVSVLAVQVLTVRPYLLLHSIAVLAGTDTGRRSSGHLLYVGLEILKVGVLLATGATLFSAFRAHHRPERNSLAPTGASRDLCQPRETIMPAQSDQPLSLTGHGVTHLASAKNAATGCSVRLFAKVTACITC